MAARTSTGDKTGIRGAGPAEGPRGARRAEDHMHLHNPSPGAAPGAPPAGQRSAGRGLPSRATSGGHPTSAPPTDGCGPR